MRRFQGKVDFIPLILKGYLLLKFFLYSILGLMPSDYSSQNVFRVPSRVSFVTSTGFTTLFTTCVVTRLLCCLLTCVPSGIGPDKTHPSFVSIAVGPCSPRTTRYRYYTPILIGPNENIRVNIVFTRMVVSKFKSL